MQVPCCTRQGDRALGWDTCAAIQGTVQPAKLELLFPPERARRFHKLVDECFLRNVGRTAYVSGFWFAACTPLCYRRDPLARVLMGNMVRMETGPGLVHGRGMAVPRWSLGTVCEDTSSCRPSSQAVISCSFCGNHSKPVKKRWQGVRSLEKSSSSKRQLSRKDLQMPESLSALCSTAPPHPGNPAPF